MPSYYAHPKQLYARAQVSMAQRNDEVSSGRSFDFNSDAFATATLVECATNLTRLCLLFGSRCLCCCCWFFSVYVVYLYMKRISTLHIVSRAKQSSHLTFEMCDWTGFLLNFTNFFCITLRFYIQINPLSYVVLQKTLIFFFLVLSIVIVCIQSTTMTRHNENTLNWAWCVCFRETKKKSLQYVYRITEENFKHRFFCFLFYCMDFK